LIPTVLFAWKDANDKIKDQLRNEIHRFLSEWRGGKTNYLLLVTRLAVFLCDGQNLEWIRPFYELINRKLITPDRNGSLFVQMLRAMEKIEIGEEKKEGDEEEKRGGQSEVERMFFDGRSVEEILRFLKPIQQFEKIPAYELVKAKGKRRGGLRSINCQEGIDSSGKYAPIAYRMINSEEWMEVRGKVLEKWRELYGVRSVGRGRWFCHEIKKRKLAEMQGVEEEE
ncbi:hypothetical protein PENTCL1PPCAC_12953, partial [Pristionchus entomophagus]